MAWYYVYESATGVLKSETSVEPTSLPAGLAYVSYPTKMLGTPGKQWDEATHAFIDVPIPPRPVGRNEFWQQFTPAERQAIFWGTRNSVMKAQTNNSTGDLNKVDTFNWYLTCVDVVDLNDPTLTIGISAMVGAGFITQARADEILAWMAG